MLKVTMEALGLTLRPVDRTDAGRLLAWRNAPEVVAWSETGAVDPAQHEAWLGRTLANPDCHFRIAEFRDQAIGWRRVDVQGLAGTVSILIDLRWQRMGYGWLLLDQAILWAAQSGLTELLARIHVANLASRRLFGGHGFRPIRQEGLWLTYQQTLSAPPNTPYLLPMEGQYDVGYLNP